MGSKVVLPKPTSINHHHPWNFDSSFKGCLFATFKISQTLSCTWCHLKALNEYWGEPIWFHNVLVFGY
jgi:hypothetical protein